MENQPTKYKPRIERGIRLIVPHEQGEIAFAWPHQGDHHRLYNYRTGGRYQNVGRGILARNLKVPTGDYLASLIHAAYCNPEIENEPEFKKIRDIIKNSIVWNFNRILWTPEGVYVVYDPECKGISEQLNASELEKELHSSPAESPICYSYDGRIRFAPKRSYKLGEHTPDSLARDGFMIAKYGQEGAEKLAEVSASKKHFKHNPKTFGIDINKGEKSIRKIAALFSGGVGGSRLEAGGSWNGDDYVRGYDSDCDSGFAFGMLE